MNVCRIYISKLELGRLIPLTDNLGRIAGGLGISIKELLRDEYSDRFDAVNAVWSDPLLTEIALMMGKLSDLERSLIILRARDLAELAADKRLVSSQKRAV
jgi:transcriptional regulator with XRE-family HTH domain